MDSDKIRAALADLPIRGFIKTGPGLVAILRADVEHTGADLDAVDRWVRFVGGSTGTTHSFVSPALGGGRWSRKVIAGTPYYAVPEAALETDARGRS